MRRSVAALVVVLVVVGAACSDPDDEDGPDPTSAAVRVDLSARDQPAQVWVDDGLFVWGGRRIPNPLSRVDVGEFVDLFLADGAIVDPPGRSGRPIAEAPFDDPLADPDAARLGDDVLVVGRTCHEAADEDNAELTCRPEPRLAAALYRPTADDWRSIELPEEIDGTVAWTEIVGSADGEFAVVRFSHDGQVQSWAVDRYANWHRIDANDRTALTDCIASRSLIQIEANALAITDLSTEEGDRRRADAPADLPIDPHGAALACADDAVYVFDPGLTHVGRYDVEADAWTTLLPATPPADPLYWNGVWTGEDLHLFGLLPDDPGYRYLPTTDSWATAPPLGLDTWPLEHAVWTGDALATWADDGVVEIELDG